LAYSVYSIASEQPFLRVLARAVLAGFPGGGTSVPLSRWTILVPNRRSARSLQAVFLEESGAASLLLPLIKPIGDIDEELLGDDLPEEGIADGISSLDQLHAILALLMQWAAANLDSELAQDVLQSGGQAFALAQSLQDLLNQFETEDVDVALLKGVYDLDLAGHRQNILELLQVITRDLPMQLTKASRIGPAARRNLLIRLEAKHIAERRHRGPVIAAGSTGTNPATRDLLQAIAQDAMGAVVLPGLDRGIDDAGFAAITAEHPQFALKAMLDKWGLTRHDVQALGGDEGLRMNLLREALRPASVADDWVIRLQNKIGMVQQAFQGVSLVETVDRQQEADVIALRLRQHVAESKGKACVITPDRDLATRIAASLRRWNLTLDDSAGEPLVHHGRAALLVLVLRCVEEKFRAPSLFALLHHEACTFGLPHAEHLQVVQALDLAGFRGLPEADGLSHLGKRLAARQVALARDVHAHPLLKAMSPETWAGTISLAAKLDAALTPLCNSEDRPLAEHIERLLHALNLVSPADEAVSAADDSFASVMQALGDGSRWHPLLSLTRAQHSIITALSKETLRPPQRLDSQLALYGLAEARLVEAELVILGGLVEQVWPARPESGAWLNRPMRDAVGVQQPERDIGLTAHDFAQGFGHGQVLLTWPKRLGGAPAIPSRFVLRLQAVMTSVGLDPGALLDRGLISIVTQLDAPRRFRPVVRPAPAPVLAVRPTRFSVSRVEKLVRDSYWIFARNILELVPVDDQSGDIDAALRGSLVHQALQDWTRAMGQVPQQDHLALLLAKGRENFAPYMEMPEVARFWWPRFMRMAADFIALNDVITADVVMTHTEIQGRHDFDVAGVSHLLTARADRIDVTDGGALRIYDYKSGAMPSLAQVKSGFAPQLTLEAAIARRTGFQGLETDTVEDVAYIGVGGGAKAVELRSLAEKNSVEDEAEKAFAGLTTLLAEFQKPNTAYIPMHNPEKQDDTSDYDHLSRRLEWQLQGRGL
jgi:ATP-dependent helicase/nuclease subunit B